jgi:hypothetical protein
MAIPMFFADRTSVRCLTLSEYANQGHGDAPAEADVDVGSRLARSSLIVSRVNGLIVLDAIVEGQGGRVERAEDDLRVWLFGREVGEIDVPECTRFPWKRHQLAEDFAGPSRRPRPINGPAPGNVLRQGNPRQPVNDALTDSRDRPGVMDIHAQVATGVNAGEDPARLRCEVLGLLGAAIRQRPRPSAPCRSASRPGASQPSSLVRSKVGRLSLNDSTFAATFLEYPVRSQDKVGDEKPVSQAAMIGLPAV